MARSERVELGYVARAHGIRGELRVVLHNPTSEALARAERLWLADRPYQVDQARPTAGAWLLRLEGVSDRTVAEGLKGRAVSVERSALGLKPGEYLLVELIGCRVFLPDGAPWGEIVAVEAGPQDRIVIRDGAVERQLPAVPVFLIEVDVAAGRVVVDPPEGLPEDPVP